MLHKCPHNFKETKPLKILPYTFLFCLYNQFPWALDPCEEAPLETQNLPYPIANS